MATRCATRSQCKIVTKYHINKTKLHFVCKNRVVAKASYF